MWISVNTAAIERARSGEDMPGTEILFTSMNSTYIMEKHYDYKTQ